MDRTPPKPSDLKGQNLTILGLGSSGTAAAALAQHVNAQVFASDPADSANIRRNLQTIRDLGCQGELGEHSKRIYSSDLWVLSPGIPQDAPVVLEAQNQDIPIVSEIEFASWFTQAPILAVTGSNGKTTTVHALARMCQSETVHGVLAGNVGIPFSLEVLNELKEPDPKRIYVLEISSFQLEFIRHFSPFISVFLNISPDHLDRYTTMEDYIQAKMNLFRYQSRDSFIVFNGDDPAFHEKFESSPATKIPFSLKRRNDTLFGLNATKIVDKEHAKLIDLEEIALPGRHNLANLLAAATAARLLGMDGETIASVMESFTGVAHRLEIVATCDGIRYVNDSKATNVEAVCVALESFSDPVVLILGGKDKGGDFKKLLSHTLKQKIREVIIYGQARERIIAALGDAVRSTGTVDLKDAVKIAQKRAKPGDTVLLSPGCSSFDQFKNFEERGDQFKQWVLALENAS